MKTFIAWTSGSETRYQITAADRKQALLRFQQLMGTEKLSSYFHARPIKPEGEYCLLESGDYGIAH